MILINKLHECKSVARDRFAETSDQVRYLRLPAHTFSCARAVFPSRNTDISPFRLQGKACWHTYLLETRFSRQAQIKRVFFQLEQSADRIPPRHNVATACWRRAANVVTARLGLEDDLLLKGNGCSSFSAWCHVVCACVVFDYIYICRISIWTGLFLVFSRDQRKKDMGENQQSNKKRKRVEQKIGKIE